MESPATVRWRAGPSAVAARWARCPRAQAAAEFLPRTPRILAETPPGGDTPGVSWQARRDELNRLHRDVRIARVPSLIASWSLAALRAPRPALRRPAPAVEAEQVAITFGGHATALVRYPGATIAFDPLLGNWVGGAHRAVEPGLTEHDLIEVDLVLISHAHRDHLHLPTLRRIPRTATVVVPSGAAGAISPLGFDRVIELRAGAELGLEAVQLSTSALHHGDASQGLSYRVAGAGPSVLLCGDSGYGPSFGQIGRLHPPDLALLPIGGFLPWSFRARHMSPLDALYAFEDLQARMMIPIHHSGFALSYERLDQPLRWLAELTRDRGLEAHVHVLDSGESEVFASHRSGERARVREPASEPELRAFDPEARAGAWSVAAAS